VFEDAGEPTLRSMADGPVPDSGFLHSLGHGVGLEVHEAPAIGLSGDDLLSGDVIAVEPGCYRRGFGGVRLEDLLLVTDAGCEVLTDFPYDL
jgi:Xaa-Pro aminopeptidase